MVPIILEPSHGPELGGNLVSVQGHCFAPQQNVQCDFEGVKVGARYESELVVHCVVPQLRHEGSTVFQLFIDAVMRGETTYTACECCYNIRTIGQYLVGNIA